MRASRPTRSPKSYRASSSSRVRARSSACARVPASPSAVCTVCSICWFVHGLVTKSDAPAFMPSTASAIDPHAVIRMTGIDGVASLICRSSVRPSSPDVRREKFMSWMIS